MLSQQLEYVALVSSDPELAASVFETHFGLPRQLCASEKGKVQLFRIGRSALAVFPCGHPLVEGETKTGVHHIALGVDDPAAAAKRAMGEGFSPKLEQGLDGRKCTRLPRNATVGIRTVLTEPLNLPPHETGSVHKLDHLGVASADVQEDEAVFCKKLGFAVESRQTDMEVRIAVESFTSDKYGVLYHNREPELIAGLRDLFVTVGDCELEFLANFNPNQKGEVDYGTSGTTRQDQGAIARYVASRGRGLHHFAVRTRDIDALLAQMDKAGVPVIDKKGRPGGRRSLIGFVHPRATGGILMHVVQRPD